ncbi:hypothetical protein [Streptomonospora litoralis]|uniref:DUF4190 domain-containing protein n=1 Tax=Streptomonospora litoralis TaxID=2498135 RepID=A0A4P6Q8V5_9ACTN|nr:hypothetical protein [Streptomonospora litoralis]QBI55971.1 hypothetical protein EKD16_21060 [Streptomonospora litoralis]
MTDNGGQRYVPPDGDHGSGEHAGSSWFTPSGDRHRTQSAYQDTYNEADAAEGGDAGRYGTPDEQPGEQKRAPAREGPPFPQRPHEQQGPESGRPPHEGERPRSTFPDSGGYPGLRAERPGMAEPYPSALGDLGPPAEPRSAGPPASPGGQQPASPGRPYAALGDTEDTGEHGRGPTGGVSAAGPGDPLTGHPADQGDARSAAGDPARSAPADHDGSAGTTAADTDRSGDGSIVAGYRLPGTPASGKDPLNGAAGTGYPDPHADAGAARGAGSTAAEPSSTAGPPTADHGSRPWARSPQDAADPLRTAGEGAGPDTQPFRAGPEPGADTDRFDDQGYSASGAAAAPAGGAARWDDRYSDSDASGARGTADGRRDAFDGYPAPPAGDARDGAYPGAADEPQRPGTAVPDDPYPGPTTAHAPGSDPSRPAGGTWRESPQPWSAGLSADDPRRNGSEAASWRESAFGAADTGASPNERGAPDLSAYADDRAPGASSVESWRDARGGAGAWSDSGRDTDPGFGSSEAASDTARFPGHGDFRGPDGPLGESDGGAAAASGDRAFGGAGEPADFPGSGGFRDQGESAANRWREPYGGAAPRDASASGDLSAHTDMRGHGDRFEGERWEPSGEDDRQPADPAYWYGAGAVGEPERYGSGAGYRLDAEPGLPSYGESASYGDGASSEWSDARRYPGAGSSERTGADPAAGAYGYDDGYDDELSRPYSHRIQADGDPAARSESPSASPSFGDTDPSAPDERVGDTGAGEGLGTGSGNTWAFSRDDSRLPESVREAVAEAHRKRRDGSPDHTTRMFGGGGPGSEPGADSGDPRDRAPAAGLGDDPLAAIAEQQARARSAEEAGGESAEREERPGAEAGSGAPAGTQQMPAVSDELGWDLRGGESAYPGEATRDRRGAGDAYDPYAQRGHYDHYDRFGPDDDSGASATYAEYGSHAGHGRYGGEPVGAQDADAGYGGTAEPEYSIGGSHAGYDSGRAQAEGAYGAAESQSPAGEWARSERPAEGYSEHTDRRGAEPPRPDGFGGDPGSAYAGLSASGAAAGQPYSAHASAGSDTAAMSLRDLEAAGDDAARYRAAEAEEYGAEPYGADPYQGAPDALSEPPVGPDGRRGRSSRERDPIREDFPGFDRPLGGDAGDAYPGYDNIDHWPDTAPEASATLWLGIAALIPVIGLFTAVAALITGPRARRAVQRSQGELEGLNLVRLGTILAWVGIGLFIVEIAGYLGAFVLA